MEKTEQERMFEEMKVYLQKGLEDKEFVKKAEELIHKFGAGYFKEFKIDGNLFCEAAYYQHMSILDLLLRSGWDINVKDEVGDNALVYALSIDGRRFEMVRYLIEKGIDVNVSYEERSQPIIQTLRFNWFQEGQLLYKNNADINIKYPKENEYGIIVQLGYLKKEERSRWIELFLQQPNRCEEGLLRKLKAKKLETLYI